MKPLHALFTRTSVALGIAMGAAGIVRAAEPPALSDFATGDGAYYTTLGSPVADPYFINKSFIIAMQAAAPLQTEFVQWLKWLLPKQRKDGGFDRFCLEADKTWHNCMAADADDSTAATTIQMLNMALQRAWIPADQQPAANQAIAASQRLLASLRNPQTQLYRVFPHTDLYYLMDNVEVYTALVASGRTKAADALASAIRHQFDQGRSWQPAFPRFEHQSFYPHVLARTFLWVPGVFTTRAEAGSDMASWMAQYGDRWRRRTDDHFAWGLVAWNLHQLAPIEAACWRHSVRPYSSAIGWTVLDAAVDVALQHSGIGVECPR